MKKKQTRKMFQVLLLFIVAFSFAPTVWANGSATLWWIAPTTDEGGGALGGGTSDLAGYKIFYNTSAIDCVSWDAGDQAYRLANPLSGSSVTVTEVAALRNAGDSTKRGYTFNGASLLTVGQNYNFAVVAYDSSGNLSKCATTSGSDTFVSKSNISYAADINTDGSSLHKVDIYDYQTFFINYGNATCGNQADITGPNNTGTCIVNIFDYNILFADFGKSF